MSEKNSISAYLYDKGRIARWEKLVENESRSHSELIRRLIDEEFERRNLEIDEKLESENQTEKPIWEEYDPDEYSGYLSDEEVRKILKKVPEPRLNPDHVTGKAPQGEAVLAVEAACRYKYDILEKEKDVEEVCLELGLVTDYYLNGSGNGTNIPNVIPQRFAGSRDVEFPLIIQNPDELVEKYAAEAFEYALWDNDDFSYNDFMDIWKEFEEIANEHWSEAPVSIYSLVCHIVYEKRRSASEIHNIATPADLAVWHLDDPARDNIEFIKYRLSEIVDDLVEEEVDFSSFDACDASGNGVDEIVEIVNSYQDQEVCTGLIDALIRRVNIALEMAERIGDDEAEARLKTLLDELKQWKEELG